MFIASINKGQFPFAFVGAVVIVLCIRIPAEEVVPLIRWIVETLASVYYLGYILFILTVASWFFHAQRVRRNAIAQLESFYATQKRPGDKRRSPGSKT